MFGDRLGAAARSTLSTPVQRNAIKRVRRIGIALSHPMCRLREHKPGTPAAIVAVARLKFSAIVHELVTEVSIAFVQGMTMECLRAEDGNFQMRSSDKILRAPLPPTLDNTVLLLAPSADAVELSIEQPVFVVDQPSQTILVRLTVSLHLVACRLPVYRRTTLIGWRHALGKSECSDKQRCTQRARDNIF